MGVVTVRQYHFLVVPHTDCVCDCLDQDPPLAVGDILRVLSGDIRDSGVLYASEALTA